MYLLTEEQYVFFFFAISDELEEESKINQLKYTLIGNLIDTLY